MHQPSENRKQHLFLSIAVLISSSILAGCSATTPADLAKLVIDEELAGIPNDFVLCISVDGKDAGSTLLEALANAGREFVPASDCVYVMDVGRGSYHRATGKKATLIDIETNFAHDRVKYVSRHDGKSGVTVTFKVVNEQGRWRIIEAIDRMEA